ncbi:MAG: hypothetical protein H6855_01115 [Rhodospirillales bacterium]|nr:hypothetical protein [Rhodospirillales bacterium]MCB9964669.1 hypothetical protein [Rhodospirillales bacterium]MCB9979959.1 hypothetical protein [Rhodospirillales bacterium]
MKATYINRQGRLRSCSPLRGERQSYDLTAVPQDRDHPEQPVSSRPFRLADWAEGSVDADPLAGGYGYEACIYNKILCQLYESPAARSLINFAVRRDWSIDMRSLEDAAYDLGPDAQVLILNDYHLKIRTFEKPGYFRHTLMLALVKGLRDIWHMECRQPYKAGLTLDSVLLLERIRAADCDVLSLMVAWELRGAGFPEVWRHLIGAPEGDIAMRFARTLERHPEKLFDGTALIEAFYQWFECHVRVGACDHQTLESIDDTLDVAREAELYGPSRPAFEFIESLSRLPDRSCYLAGYGEELSSNPLFAGMNDELNQLHYLQIQKELQSVTIGAVSFRDAALAARIFPDRVS